MRGSRTPIALPLLIQKLGLALELTQFLVDFCVLTNEAVAVTQARQPEMFEAGLYKENIPKL